MRALVTGVAGFIGSRLAEVLVNNGWDVIGCDSFTPYYSRQMKEANLGWTRRAKNITLIEGDTRSAVKVETLDNIDVVFHQAGQAGVRGSWSSSFVDYVDLNILATQDLLEKILAAAARPRLVMASSSSVYGNAMNYPLSEAAETRPFSPYGVTKLSAERLALAYEENFGLEVAALRYFTVYGPRQRPDMAISRLIAAAIGGAPFPLYGDGNKVRDFTFVDDVVRANMLAASADLQGLSVFNICGGTSSSLSDVIASVGRSVGSDPKVDLCSPEAGDVDRTGGDNTRAKTILGWHPTTTLADGIAAQVQWSCDVTPTPMTIESYNSTSASGSN